MKICDFINLAFSAVPDNERTTYKAFMGFTHAVHTDTDTIRIYTWTCTMLIIQKVEKFFD